MVSKCGHFSNISSFVLVITNISLRGLEVEVLISIKMKEKAFRIRLEGTNTIVQVFYIAFAVKSVREKWMVTPRRTSYTQKFLTHSNKILPRYS